MQAAKKTGLFGTSASHINQDTQAFFGGLFAKTSDAKISQEQEHTQNDVAWQAADTLDM